MSKAPTPTVTPTQQPQPAPIPLHTRFEDDKKKLIARTTEYLNGTPELLPDPDTLRKNAAQYVADGKYSEALQTLEKLRDAKSGIVLHELPQEANDTTSRVVIRDARNAKYPPVRETEAFEMQYLNAIRAAMELAEIEKKPELKQQLQEQANKFIAGKNNLNEKFKQDLEAIEKLRQECAGNDPKKIDEYEKAAKELQKKIAKAAEKAIGSVAELLERNEIKDAYKKLNVAKDFQNFNDTHANVVTISAIPTSGMKESRTVIEADVALKGLTEEQKEVYKKITELKKLSLDLSQIHQDLSQIDQELKERKDELNHLSKNINNTKMYIKDLEKDYLENDKNIIVEHYETVYNKYVEDYNKIWALRDNKMDKRPKMFLEYLDAAHYEHQGEKVLPKWFREMPKWERDLVCKHAETILDGNHVMPTQLRQLPGMKNAFEHITADFNPKTKQLEILDAQKHAGTLASLARDEDSRRQITEQNARQAQEWIGEGHKLHANTFNSGPTMGVGDDPEIVARTSTAMKAVGGHHTNTPFNYFRFFGAANDFSGAKEVLQTLSKKFDDKGEYFGIGSSVLKPRGFLKRLFGIDNTSRAKYKLDLALKDEDNEVRKILETAIDLRDAIEQADTPFRIFGDRENVNLDVSTHLGSLSQQINKYNKKQKEAHKDSMFKDINQETLKMCTSGKDRTFLELMYQSIKAIAKKFGINTENPAEQAELDRKMLQGGHAAQQAGGVFAGGGSIGNFGTKNENEFGRPAHRPELKAIMEESANHNKIKKPKKHKASSKTEAQDKDTNIEMEVRGSVAARSATLAAAQEAAQPATTSPTPKPKKTVTWGTQEKVGITDQFEVEENVQIVKIASVFDKNKYIDSEVIIAAREIIPKNIDDKSINKKIKENRKYRNLTDEELRLRKKNKERVK